MTPIETFSTFKQIVDVANRQSQVKPAVTEASVTTVLDNNPAEGQNLSTTDDNLLPPPVTTGSEQLAAQNQLLLEEPFAVNTESPEEVAALGDVVVTAAEEALEASPDQRIDVRVFDSRGVAVGSNHNHGDIVTEIVNDELAEVGITDANVELVDVGTEPFIQNGRVFQVYNDDNLINSLNQTAEAVESGQADVDIAVLSIEVNGPGALTDGANEAIQRLEAAGVHVVIGAGNNGGLQQYLGDGTEATVAGSTPEQAAEFNHITSDITPGAFDTSIVRLNDDGTVDVVEDMATLSDQEIADLRVQALNGYAQGTSASAPGVAARDAVLHNGTSQQRQALVANMDQEERDNAVLSVLHDKDRIMQEQALTEDQFYTEYGSLFGVDLAAMDAGPVPPPVDEVTPPPADEGTGTTPGDTFNLFDLLNFTSGENVFDQFTNFFNQVWSQFFGQNR